MSSEVVPVAVVGVGHMGRHHARIYSELPGARLVAVVDRDLARAREIAAPYHAEALASVEALPGTIRAASVAVPTSAHRAIADLLLARGVAVLVEKPIAASVAEAEQMVAAARRYNGLLAVGHTERFNPAVRAIQRLDIHPKFIETDRISPFSFRSADIGVVADMMIHDIDIVLDLVARGSPTRRPQVRRVEAVGVNVLGPHEDIANARVMFDNGAVANLTASRLALKTERKLRVFSHEAYVSVDYHRKSGIAIVKDANLDLLKMAAEGNFEDLSQMKNVDFGRLVKVEPLVVDDVEPLRAELESFLHSVRTGTPPAVSAEDGMAAVALAAQIAAAVRAHDWSPAPESRG
jgi:predicted dehydrogenase